MSEEKIKKEIEKLKDKWAWDNMIHNVEIMRKWFKRNNLCNENMNNAITKYQDTIREIKDFEGLE